MTLGAYGKGMRFRKSEWLSLGPTGPDADRAPCRQGSVRTWKVLESKCPLWERKWPLGQGRAAGRSLPCCSLHLPPTTGACDNRGEGRRPPPCRQQAHNGQSSLKPRDGQCSYPVHAWPDPPPHHLATPRIIPPRAPPPGVVPV